MAFLFRGCEGDRMSHVLQELNIYEPWSEADIKACDSLIRKLAATCPPGNFYAGKDDAE
jgi:hypothetical protein